MALAPSQNLEDSLNNKKLLLVALLFAGIGSWFLLDLQAYFSLEYFQAQRERLLAFKANNFWLSSLLYFLLYVAVAALSLPAAAIITLVGGALFGFWWGLVLASFASSIGATLAFLLARTIGRDWVQRRFAQHMELINRGIEKDGIFYLFTLRLVPLFPFFLVNVVMALTPIRTFSFYWVSQTGMLLGTALYVNVGSQLGLATSVPGILSIGIIRAVLILAVFPWFAKWLVAWFQRRRQLRPFSKPRKFDTNLLVIGAGSAGLVTAYIAALVKARVTLVEQHRMGGDCLNTGCVPSKALLRSAAVMQLFRRAADFGLRSSGASADFAAVMGRVQQIIRTIEPHDSVERYQALGVDCVKGTARITSPWTVEVDGRQITTRSIVIATGSKPGLPEIPGLAEIAYLTSDTIWNLTALPPRLLVLGGGPIGCELAQAFARLGSQVSLINRGPRLLPREDADVSALLTQKLTEEGIRVFNNGTVTAFTKTASTSIAAVSCGGKLHDIAFDEVLVAVGRQVNTEGLGLEALGMAITQAGAPVVNAFLQTSFPNIFACGDVAGPYQFTHMAAFQAWYASVNSLFGGLRKFRVNYRVVPWTTFTDPAIARAGINEQEAAERNIPFEISRFELAELDRAIADSDSCGFIKVLTVPGKDRILGVTIVGNHAAELLAEFTLAMTHGLGLKKIMNTIHVYPTFSEANKYAAGEWRKQHAPEWLYPWLERYHRWRLGG